MANTADFVLLTLAGWLNRRQHEALTYLREENRVLREQLGPKRLLLTDDQRRRLALKGKALGRRLLAATATVVTPDTILRWHRRLVAGKYDGSTARRPELTTGPHAPRLGTGEVCPAATVNGSSDSGADVLRSLRKARLSFGTGRTWEHGRPAFATAALERKPLDANKTRKYDVPWAGDEGAWRSPVA